MLSTLYRSSLALLTDLYQLTMAYGYWKSGVAERDAVFHLFFRKIPFGGGYAVAAGLATAIEYMQQFRFAADDLDYLGSLQGNDGKPLLAPEFLAYLGAMRFSCDVDAMPEGSAVFAHEPLLCISGPIMQAQLLETALLCIMNFQTLIASKAARVCQATRGEPVLEFGLRRAQGVDGGVSASRAAYIGGCAATSNVLAGKLLGIPVRGTHAHSWIMFFDDELSAFSAYADAMPNNCVFLVDTYDTLGGVKNAIEVGKALRARGHQMAGIRLDSGDLAYLSIAARKLLDEAGFDKAAIVASNELDESIIASLKEQGATINVWGVGTKLVTAYDQPALGGVYKLAAVREAVGPGGGGKGAWQHRIKLSEQRIKISNPGLLQVRRYSQGGCFVGDMLYDIDSGVSADRRIYDIDNPLFVHDVGPVDGYQDVLVPIFRGGEQVYQPPDLHATRALAHAEIDKLDPRTRRFLNPQSYPVGLEKGLSDRKQELIARARGIGGGES